PRPTVCLASTLTLSSITRPPPRPTLFPYTTLFRSRIGLDHIDQLPLHARGAAVVAVGRGDETLGVAEGDERAERLAAGSVPESEDRKSTRLNSSHQIISYAVFCLKKKTS